ncbi:hypothetical protein CPB84DRAFT_1818021 [Gymnopilus junonius]|uniref:CxC6 like cysteine cluster associated with KDZ domain-containing protein n=1 Tax=Gymnopilus junonius TaxID=109634 RepID=A0A9P5TF29_GYMJU|nr:hypothetical protein CPB84DRAFT_1818021 [Gymnopilus junonius]
MDIDYDDVTMAIIDGLVMTPTHCAYDGCTQDLQNARGGAFCAEHERSYGDKCRIRDCRGTKVANTQACQRHQPEWRKYKLDHSRSTLSGVRRMLQRPEELNAWQPGLRQNFQPHDNNENAEIPRKNYFGPGKFYCVETITKPCGVVVAWTKFDKSESPTKILNWLGSVYPTEESRPNYLCIDKGCQVLRTSIMNGTWDLWKRTSRITVDSYHYLNHCTSDYLCHKYCNPAPMNGSAPNLVITDVDKNGDEYLKCAFNTQACEQLNAWLGGFDSIVKRMKSGNFNWFLHSMLFYHTNQVIQKQEQKTKIQQIVGNDDDEGEEDEEMTPVGHWDDDD